MKRRLNPIVLFLSIFMLTSLACSLLTPAKSATSEKGKTPAATKAAAVSKFLADEFRSESGGFSIRKVKDYDFKEVIGIVSMTAPDANSEVGPGIMAMGGLNDTDATAAELLQKVRTESSALTFSPEKKIRVGSQEGWAMEVKGTYNDLPIVGRMVVVMVTPRQQFTMLAISPAERWQELAPIYDAVLTSVNFFEARPEAAVDATPTTEPAVVLPTEAAETIVADTQGQEIRQWAASARASSQYSDSDWSARQAVGEPDVEDCGDNGHAWASQKPDGIDWIELTYPTPVTPTEINIYQSYNPSQVYEVDMIDTNGDVYIMWAGEPEKVSNCPDLMTISVELDEVLLVQKIKILVDQSVLKSGWGEIDAVELVGKPSGSQASQSKPAKDPTQPANQTVPTNYSGWMAGPVYQGYLKVIPGQTRVEELNSLIGLQGKRSTENWKPRPTHADTFIFDLKKDNMLAWISVDTSGVVYKVEISANTYPSDFQLETVKKASYDQLDAIFKRDKVVPYEVVANLLGSPGFRNAMVLLEDGRIETDYKWYNANGDRMIGFFFNGRMTGMAGLAFIPKE